MKATPDLRHFEWPLTGRPVAKVERLAYCATADVMVALYDNSDSTGIRRAVYVRRGARAYRRLLPDRAHRNSVVWDLVQSAKPTVFYLSSWRLAPEKTGMRFEKIMAFDCEAMKVAQVLSLEQLRFPQRGSGWIAGLLSSEQGGRSLLVRAAVHPTEAGKAVPYFIARLYLKSARVELLAPLEGVFS
jgi:hypothetical protein